MSARRSLDPDEITCPTCASPPGVVCLTPKGRKAKTIHRARRDTAATAGDRQDPPKKAKRPAPARETAVAGGKAKAAQARADRKLVEAVIGRRRAQAIIDDAEKLAHDVVERVRLRETSKRLTLDNLVRALGTLGAALEGYRAVELDAEGRPLIVAREVTDEETGETVRDRDGRAKVKRGLDYRGAYGPDDVQKLSVAVGILIDKVRLEEGSVTSRSEVLTPEAAIAELSDEELRRMHEETIQLERELRDGREAAG